MNLEQVEGHKLAQTLFQCLNSDSIIFHRGHDSVLCNLVEK